MKVTLIGASGERKGTCKTGSENPVFDTNNRSVLPVEDLAVVIADEAENPKHSRQAFYSRLLKGRSLTV